MSRIEQIWSTIEQLMHSAAPDARILRDPPGDFEEGAELALHTGRVRRLVGETGSVTRALDFRIEGSVSGENAQSDINRMHAAVVDALIADPTLGELVNWVEDRDGRFSTVPRSEVRILSFDQGFTLEFSAAHGRLSTP